MIKWRKLYLNSIQLMHALLLKIRNYIKLKTLRNTYFTIFDSHLSCFCISWDQNFNATDWLFFRNHEFQRPVISRKDTFLYNHHFKIFPLNAYHGSTSRRCYTRQTLKKLNIRERNGSRQNSLDKRLIIKASTIYSWNSIQDFLIKNYHSKIQLQKE